MFRDLSLRFAQGKLREGKSLKLESHPFASLVAVETPWAIVDFPGDRGPRTRQVFRDPIEVCNAWSLTEVVPALDRVVRRTAEGKFAVGFVAYDAAPAFDRAFQVRAGYEGPLVWFGIFDGPTADVIPQGADVDRGRVWSTVDAAEHARAVATIIGGIGRGDYYQVNYTARVRTSGIADPLSVYERLAQAQGPSYSAFIDTGELSILSASPELFFRRDGSQIETRPMKGTATRGRWPADDDAAAERLKSSEKERAENVMIVDLLRNDLGRISVVGSVEVPSLFDVERYPTVWQMTSSVKSQIADSTTVSSIFKALFPCGSVTGAPKIAASQAIAELESGPRGVYCGAVGIVKPGGDCVFNVAIRTVVVNRDGTAVYGAGGGITSDSTPAQEFAELVAKTAVLEARPNDFDLFETMRLSDGVIQRLDRHLARLEASVAYFGFDDPGRAVTRLSEALQMEAAGRPTGLFRVRATLQRGGEHLVEVLPFTESGKPRRMMLASTPVQSSDRLLFHKTTRRDAYSSRLEGAARDVDDVILFNERDEVTECTIGNIVLELKGKSITPALACGLLPGVLRQELLDTEKIVERVFRVEDLASCKQLWMINSLRGWIPIELRQ